jgi:cytochrome c oxidase assembly factor CtaG
MVGTGWWSDLWRWSFEPLVIEGLVAAALAYAHGLRIVGRRRSARVWRGAAACFFAGLVVLAVALLSPVDTFADDSLATHMVQHLLLTLVAPPLLLLGRPLTLAHAASSRRTGARLTSIARHPVVRLLGHPAVGFASFTLVLWASHVTSLYEATLTDTWLHAGEHIAYVISASLFWWPVVARDPGSRRLSHPARLLYLFLSMPVMSLLGFVVSSNERVLYPHYIVAAGSVAAALRDQRLAGTIMWESSMLCGAFALAFVLMEWLAHDEAEGARTDALQRASIRRAEIANG